MLFWWRWAGMTGSARAARNWSKEAATENGVPGILGPPTSRKSLMASSSMGRPPSVRRFSWREGGRRGRDGGEGGRKGRREGGMEGGREGGGEGGRDRWREGGTVTKAT